MPADAQISTHETAPDAGPDSEPDAEPDSGPDAGPEALRRSGSPATNRATPTCLTCHYALTGVPTPRCPECGRPFDPADPSTFGPRRSVVRLALRHAAPHPAWNVTCCILAGLAALCLTPPGGYRGDGALFVFTLVPSALGLLWSFSIALSFVMQLIHLARGQSLKRRPLKSWLIIPLAIILCGINVATGASWHARWFISKPFLQDAANRMIADPSLKCTGVIGLFFIENAGCVNPQAVFFDLGLPDLYGGPYPTLIHYKSPYRPWNAPFNYNLSRDWYLAFNNT